MSNINKEKVSGRRNKKRVLIVLSVILLIVLAVTATVGIKFRSHIKAAIIFLTTSNEDIQKNIDDAKDKQTEVLNSSGFNASKELDEALMSGKITAEEHTEILIGNLTLEQALEKNNNSEEVPPDIPPPQSGEVPKEDETPPAADKSQEKQPPEKTDSSKPADTGQKKNEAEAPETKHETTKESPGDVKTENTQKNPQKPAANSSADVDKRTAELVTRMYVLKSEYTAQVEGIVNSMKAEYSKLPPEQRTLSAKRSIATGYLGTINAMEAQCDAQVNAIVAELRQLLSANGRDTAIADSILSTYASEKENTKAYYLSTYGD